MKKTRVASILSLAALTNAQVAHVVRTDSVVLPR